MYSWHVVCFFTARLITTHNIHGTTRSMTTCSSNVQGRLTVPHTSHGTTYGMRCTLGLWCAFSQHGSSPLTIFMAQLVA
ncbi:hypothetical protein DUNSADRAFT_14464 [Dunaliella salina]|uniref:Secreted protein n=1 Tax=Dunaliella salina TaxID=3046 RepID=A0ABQ7H9L1_DUNSA|nr:hypothetical protein DUNSADRAFT_14464 [Dunaliella salina]|eukprot:KAF5843549.1 hypothetical protein DUNSADRAFT_14464 [Dunaliella salina]